ncbi:hypothetical protein ACH5RR_029929 [Cinchona calisaya]|uniref:Uncharacterized protein n=1 Tax=Cinchona calisaya TaxID=153742 RepID=A0ABD2YYC9_9GENT
MGNNKGELDGLFAGYDDVLQLQWCAYKITKELDFKRLLYEILGPLKSDDLRSSWKFCRSGDVQMLKEEDEKAVTPTNANLANSDALHLAGATDPNEHIGLLLQLDIMNRDIDALNFLLEKLIPLKLDNVGVVNRSQEVTFPSCEL